MPSGRGELKNIIVTGSPDGDLMIRFVLRSSEAVVRIEKYLPLLLERLPQARVVSVNLLPERKAVLEGDVEIILTEAEALPMNLGEVTLFLRPQSFFQTNTEVAVALYRQAAAWVDDALAARTTGLSARTESGPGAGPTTGAGLEAESGTDGATGNAPTGGRIERIWDMYSGVGGFGLHCAASKRAGREVVGVEISEQAIESAKASASLAGIDAHFLAGDATKAAASLPSPDLAIVNPPRRGIGELADWLEDSGISTVLYSSCNPLSLAKDLDAMSSFRVDRARVFDMFPHTTHTETLALLTRA